MSPAAHPLAHRPAPWTLGRRVALVAAALALWGCAAPPSTNGDDRAATRAALRAQADAWDRAIVRQDRPAIEANMAEDFRQIDSRGGVRSRQVFIDRLMSPDLVIDPYTVEDFDIRLYGDVALLSGRTRMTGRYAGEVFASHYRYIDVYVKRGGRWQIVSVQITTIPE